MKNIVTQVQKNEIDSLCQEYDIENYTINSDGTLDVNGNVEICFKNIDILPLKFRFVTGDFYCNNNLLTTLDGCPIKLGGSLNCTENELTHLEGAPSEIGGHFKCYDNKLTSLRGCPKVVGGEFECDNNRLDSLIYGPTKVGVHFRCDHNRLHSLEYSPKEVGGGFECRENEMPGEFYNILRLLCGFDEYMVDNMTDFDDDDEDGDGPYYYTFDNEKVLTFFKYMHYYDVWTPEFNLENAKELAEEIEDGLK